MANAGLFFATILCSVAQTLNMAAAPSTKPNGDKVRKRSFSGGLPLFNRSGSMADKTLLGVLNILRMDEEASNTFLLRTILPDGNLRLVRRSFS